PTTNSSLPRASPESPGRANSPCTSRVSSPTPRFPRSAGSSVGETTPRSSTPSAAPASASPRTPLPMRSRAPSSHASATRVATDLEVGLRVPLEASVETDGTAVLPARLLLDVVRALPADAVTLELRAAEQDVEITSGGATFHIRTLRAEDFPPLPEPDREASV